MSIDVASVPPGTIVTGTEGRISERTTSKLSTQDNASFKIFGSGRMC